MGRAEQTDQRAAHAFTNHLTKLHTDSRPSLDPRQYGHLPRRRVMQISLTSNAFFAYESRRLSASRFFVRSSLLRKVDLRSIAAHASAERSAAGSRRLAKSD
jgi:hypothetical protein